MELVLAGVIVALLVAMAGREWFAERERDAARRERAELLQRIQAPEVAVATHVEEVAAPQGLMHVPVGDFEAWLEDQKEQGVTFDA